MTHIDAVIIVWGLVGTSFDRQALVAVTQEKVKCSTFICNRDRPFDDIINDEDVDYYFHPLILIRKHITECKKDWKFILIFRNAFFFPLLLQYSKNVTLLK